MSSARAWSNSEGGVSYLCNLMTLVDTYVYIQGYARSRGHGSNGKPKLVKCDLADRVRDLVVSYVAARAMVLP